MEASEGGDKDGTGSEYLFVETSGETASGADCGTEAVGDGVRKSTGAVVGEGGLRRGADWRRWKRRGLAKMGGANWRR